MIGHWVILELISRFYWLLLKPYQQPVVTVRKPESVGCNKVSLSESKSWQNNKLETSEGFFTDARKQGITVIKPTHFKGMYDIYRKKRRRKKVWSLKCFWHDKSRIDLTYLCKLGFWKKKWHKGMLKEECIEWTS